MSDKHRIVTAAGLVLGALLAVYLYYHWEAGQRAAQEPTPELAALELEPDTPEAAAENQPVELYLFAPENGKPGAAGLQAVTRELPLVEDPVIKARDLVNAVIRESPQIVPPIGRVIQTYLLEDGTAIVDLSREVAEQLNGGTATELGLLRSFTRSLRANIPQIEQVRFLVEGEQRPTLSGHVSIVRPFM